MSDARVARDRPKLLLITGLFPTPDAPAAGVFVARRAEAAGAMKVIAPRHYGGSALARYVALTWRALTARGRFEGVEVHWLFPTGLIGLLAARLRRIPLVVYAHGDDIKTSPQRSPLHHWLVALVCRSADAVVTNSDDTARYVRGLGREPHVIFPGVDLRRFHPTPRPHRRRVLYLGGATPGKGFELASRIADTLIGPGIDERRPDEIPDLMASHDIVLVPSTEEAFGVVAAEAIASGRWVVATSVGGLREVVTHGVNGTLVEDGDFDAALAQVPDYDPIVVATTAERFDQAHESLKFESLWHGLIAREFSRS